jgi:hypothetical protein
MKVSGQLRVPTALLWGRASGAHWVVDWVDPRAGANDLQNIKISEFFTFLGCYAAYLILGYRRLGTDYRSHLQGSVCPRRIHATEQSAPATSLRRPASQRSEDHNYTAAQACSRKENSFARGEKRTTIPGFSSSNLITDYAVPAP